MARLHPGPMKSEYLSGAGTQALTFFNIPHAGLPDKMQDAKVIMNFI